MTEYITELDNDNTVKQHMARYKFARKYAENKSVLDVGCGNGYGVEYLKPYCVDALEPYSHIIGVDKNAGFDITKDTLPTKFDVILCFEVIEHLKDTYSAINNIMSMLERTGTLIISTPNRVRNNFQINHYHEREYTHAELNDILSEFFRLKFFAQYIYRDTRINKMLRKYRVQAFNPKREKEIQNMIVVCKLE